MEFIKIISISTSDDPGLPEFVFLGIGLQYVTFELEVTNPIEHLILSEFLSSEFSAFLDDYNVDSGKGAFFCCETSSITDGNIFELPNLNKESKPMNNQPDLMTLANEAATEASGDPLFKFQELPEYLTKYADSNTTLSESDIENIKNLVSKDISNRMAK